MYVCMYFFQSFDLRFNVPVNNFRSSQKFLNRAKADWAFTSTMGSRCLPYNFDPRPFHQAITFTPTIFMKGYAKLINMVLLALDLRWIHLVS